MKWFLLHIAFMILAVNTQTHAVDSIKNLLLQNPKPDTNRVKLLNKLSGELRSHDIERSRSIAGEAYNLPSGGFGGFCFW